MNRATIIITDEGYLVPSLVLANQLVEQKLNLLTDVIVFLVDIDGPTERWIRATFGTVGIMFRSLRLDALGISPEAAFAKSHVPVTALARLAIYDHIPRMYEDVVYLDGDMQVIGDVSPLLKCQVPEGQIAASVENFVLWRDDKGEQPEWISSYLKTIGLDRASQYFNSGLLAFRRETWQEVGSAALRFFNRNSEICRHHDQTALNAVCRDRWLPISPAYNFHTYFAPLLHDRIASPKIVHFTSTPKPWQSPDSLWPTRFAGPYRKLLSEHPQLRRFIDTYDANARRDLLRYLRQLKRKLVFRLDRDGRRKNFKHYIDQNDFFIS